jgi:homoserine O-succinyltransferase
VNYKIAILDMYQGHENQGMRGLKDIITTFGLEHNTPLSFEVFDLRTLCEIPNVNDFDVFISTGGPGSPVDSAGSEWEKKFFGLTDAIIKNNESEKNKKYLFLICHSFQVFCRYYNYGLVCERKSPAFGVHPVHKTQAGLQDDLLTNLVDPFYIVESRDWQVIQPNLNKFFETGAEVLALEKERPRIPLERALMAVRFSDEIYGTQFHPEADGPGMRHYLLTDEKKKAQVIEQYGEEKYAEMVDRLDDEDKIILTRKEILPNFLRKKLLSMVNG